MLVQWNLNNLSWAGPQWDSVRRKFLLKASISKFASIIQTKIDPFTPTIFTFIAMTFLSICNMHKKWKNNTEKWHFKLFIHSTFIMIEFGCWSSNLVYFFVNFLCADLFARSLCVHILHKVNNIFWIIIRYMQILLTLWKCVFFSFIDIASHKFCSAT